MSLRYALDTNVLSEPLRPRPNESIMHHLRIHDAEIAVPSPVWHELRFGCVRLPPSRRRDAIERYIEDVVLPNFPILDYDQAAAEWHAVQRGRLARSGKPPPFVDGQIAAIANVNGLALVTANTKDFSTFEGLQVMSWS